MTARAAQKCDAVVDRLRHDDRRIGIDDEDMSHSLPFTKITRNEVSFIDILSDIS
jgi:hypothetical protein